VPDKSRPAVVPKNLGRPGRRMFDFFDLSGVAKVIQDTVSSVVRE
jgi:hypothetical protein